MTRNSIPDTVKFFLWGKSAGRCQYRGCNKKLFEDPLKKSGHNHGYHAHIIGASIHGPRGKNTSPIELRNDISNIMLLCDSCHRRIDHTEKKLHDPNLLKKMKI